MFIAIFVAVNFVIAAIGAAAMTNRRVRRGGSPSVLYPMVIFVVVFAGAVAAEAVLLFGACVLMLGDLHGLNK